jgi:hypothetical protein
MATATYEWINTITLGSPSASITFSSIPSTYTDLVLVGNPTVSASLDYKWYVNGSTLSDYSQTRVLGSGTGVGAGRTVGAGYLYLDATAPASGSIQNFIMNFMNYSNTSVNKTVLVRYNDAGTETAVRANLWRVNSAISSITISTDSSTFATGSNFSLYGIKAA